MNIASILYALTKQHDEEDVLLLSRERVIKYKNRSH